MSPATRHFIRHYFEMVIVMVAGMFVLGAPLALVVDTSETGAMIASMGVTMTVPMVTWMLWRGHDWRPTAEMAGAMIVPTLGALALFATDMVDNRGLLVSAEHAVMFTAMLGVMLLRRDEYSHHAHREAVA